MKTLLTLFAFCIVANTTIAQMINFTFEISEEVYSDMIRANDQVEDLKQFSQYGYSNFSFKFSEAESDKSSFWQDVYAEFYSPVPGGDKRIAKVKVDASLAFNGIDKTKKLIVNAKLKTAFKNNIWTEKEIPAGRYNENIVLDQYNKTASDDFPADKLSGLALSFEQPWAADRHNYFSEELAANNDSLMKFQEGKFHVQMKNEGDVDWKADVYPNDEPTSTYRAVDVYIKKYNFDYNKNFIFRISVKTKNGNYLWREMLLAPNQLSAELIADQYYSGVEFDSIAPPKNGVQVPESNTEVEETQELNEEITDDNAAESQETEIDSNEAIAIETEPSVAESFSCSPGDTTLKSYHVYNEQICVKDFKYNMRGNVQGLLSENFDVTVNGISVPLKGGTQIVLDESKNYIISSTLAENTSFKQDGAEFVMKADSKIEFSQLGITGVNIEGEGTLEFNDVSFGCKPKAESKGFDIQFDNKGRLQEFTSSTETKWNGSIEFNIPSESRVSIKNGKMKSVSIVEPTEIALNDNTYQIVPGKYASLIFDSNEALESFTVGSNHTFDINGQSIPIETNSKVNVTYDGSYHISTIIAGSKVTVTVEKKGKTKEVEVKPGKKIVIENGIIVKAG